MAVAKADGKSRTRAGFTLIELLVVVSIIALLISILLPSLGKAKETANKTVCAANLRGISQAMFIYGSNNNDIYPCCTPGNANAYANSFVQNPSGNTSADQLSIALSANQGVPLASFWMLILGGGADAKQFWCKSDQFLIGPAAKASNGSFYSNFQDQYQISYSLAYPWLGNSVSSNWRASLKTSNPIISDMAPLTGTNGKNTTMLKGQTSKAYNSSNHDDKGQNIGFGDGHAEFCTDPYRGGDLLDNIFTTGPTNGQNASGLNNIGTIYSTTDFVMVPVRDTSTGLMGN